MELFCGNSQFGRFHREAPLLMFAEILNATLSEEVSAIGVTQWNLELPLPPNSLDSHSKHKNNKMKSWNDLTSSFPLGRTCSLNWP